MKQPPHHSQQTRLKVIAGIPCFNTSRSIKDIVSRARKYVDQVIVIDDGSSDGTAEVAGDAGALVISHQKNLGYGEAIKSCFKAAGANAADILVILDGDGQHNPDEIPRLLAPILDGEAELVIGSRFLTDEPNMPRYRRFGIKVITFLWNFGAKVKVSDTQSGFRAYRREIFETMPLSEKRMSISIEIIEKARRKGAIIKEVPISCSYVPSGINSKAIKHGLAVALSVIKIRLLIRLTA
ncbi:MAG: glycosyltransferase family 2 protein [Chloroflexi bacterium]|nr:glycosyltransferase family 2 protein [Chloroflexota bacterium]